MRCWEANYCTRLTVRVLRFLLNSLNANLSKYNSNARIITKPLKWETERFQHNPSHTHLPTACLTSAYVFHIPTYTYVTCYVVIVSILQFSYLCYRFSPTSVKCMWSGGRRLPIFNSICYKRRGLFLLAKWTWN
jgi:hypothetical protein